MKKPIIDVKSYNFYKRPSVFCALCCAYLCTAFLIFAGSSVYSAETKALEYKDLVGSYKVMREGDPDDAGAITLTFERKIAPPLEPSEKAEDEGTQLPQFKDLVGSYKATSSLMPGIENFVTFEENGSVTLKEVHPEGSINCDGKATIVGQVLISNMSCKHIAFANEEIIYTQKIDLSTIKPLGADKLEDADMFEAIVFTSLLEMEIPMVFERVGVKE